MGIEQNLLEVVRNLPPERQQEVLDFAQSLKARFLAKKPLKSAEGLLADLGTQITEEDIDEARREMWGNFPREDIL